MGEGTVERFPCWGSDLVRMSEMSLSAMLSRIFMRLLVPSESSILSRKCLVTLRAESTSASTVSFWRQLYKNRSSRKINSRILLSREWDFQKTLSLTENQFSRKTYFYKIHPCLGPSLSLSPPKARPTTSVAMLRTERTPRPTARGQIVQS